MRPGIRAKFIVILILAGLLPLLLLLGAIQITAANLRTRTIGKALQSQAIQQADHLSALLDEQVRFIELIATLPQNLPTLQVANAAPSPTPDQIDQIEQHWPKTTETDEPLRSILNNPIALMWQSIQYQQPRYVEVLVTDTAGRVVASTSKTADYYQADKKWWRDCYAEGAGHTILMGVEHDESAPSLQEGQSAAVWQVCLPIYSPGSATRRNVIGILKVKVHARRLHEQLQKAAAADINTRMWLSRGDGKPVRFTAKPADLPQLPESLMQQMHHQAGGWIGDSGLSGHELMGFAAVPAPPNSTMDGFDWYVIISADRVEAMGPIHWLTAAILVGGIGLIILFSMLGWLIIRRWANLPVQPTNRMQ